MDHGCCTPRRRSDVSADDRVRLRPHRSDRPPRLLHVDVARPRLVPIRRGRRDAALLGTAKHRPLWHELPLPAQLLGDDLPDAPSLLVCARPADECDACGSARIPPALRRQRPWRRPAAHITAGGTRHGRTRPAQPACTSAQPTCTRRSSSSAAAPSSFRSYSTLRATYSRSKAAARAARCSSARPSSLAA